MPEKVILNLGCGTIRIPGSIGVDCVPIEGFADVVWNLDKFPYPFPESYADEVWLIFTLEHLEDPFKVLEEVYRILKPQGKVFIRVPHFSSCYCWGELTHKRAFSSGFWSVFSGQDNNARRYYSKAEYSVVDLRVKYFLTYPPIKWFKSDSWKPHWEKFFIVGRLIKIFVSVVQFLIDLSPEIFERFWCYYVGGAAEICCVLKAEKSCDKENL